MASPPEEEEELQLVSPALIINILPVIVEGGIRFLDSHFGGYATISLLFVSPIASLPIFSLYFFSTCSGAISSSLPLVVGVVLLLASLAILSAIFGVLIITYFVTIDSGFSCVSCPTTIPSAVRHLLSTSFAPFLLTAAAVFAEIAAISLPLSAVVTFSTFQFLEFFQIHSPIPRLLAFSVSIFACPFCTMCVLLPRRCLAPAIALLEKKKPFQSIKKSVDTLKFNRRLPDANQLFLRRVFLQAPILAVLAVVYCSYSGPDPLIDSVGVAVLLAAAATLFAWIVIFNFTAENTLLYLHSDDPEDYIDARDEAGNIRPRRRTAEIKTYRENYTSFVVRSSSSSVKEIETPSSSETDDDRKLSSTLKASIPIPPIKVPKRVVLVRHGQSTWNEEGACNLWVWKIDQYMPSSNTVLSPFSYCALL